MQISVKSFNFGNIERQSILWRSEQQSTQWEEQPSELNPMIEEDSKDDHIQHENS